VKAGHSGSAGRKLPLQVAVEVHPSSSKAENGRTLVDFILTNSGKKNLAIPVSTNPDDLGQADSFLNLWLYITSDKRHETVLQAGTDRLNPFVNLYGSHAVQGTVVTLLPGESIRVRAEVSLPPVSNTDQENALVLVAHVVLDRKTITSANGQPIMDSHEVGSATSSEYTREALLKSAN
jgi:hypothetical protein